MSTVCGASIFLFELSLNKTRKHVVTTAALHTIECPPLMEEVDTEPTTRPSTAWPQGKPQEVTRSLPPI